MLGVKLVQPIFVEPLRWSAVGRDLKLFFIKFIVEKAVSYVDPNVVHSFVAEFFNSGYLLEQTSLI